eukprot:403333597
MSNQTERSDNGLNESKARQDDLYLLKSFKDQLEFAKRLVEKQNHDKIQLVQALKETRSKLNDAQKVISKLNQKSNNLVEVEIQTEFMCPESYIEYERNYQHSDRDQNYTIQDSTRIIRVDDQSTTTITPRDINLKMGNSVKSHNRLMNVFENITNSESEFSKMLREKNQKQKFEKFFHGLLDKSNNVSPQMKDQTPDFDEEKSRVNHNQTSMIDMNNCKSFFTTSIRQLHSISSLKLSEEGNNQTYDNNPSSQQSDKFSSRPQSRVKVEPFGEYQQLTVNFKNQDKENQNTQGNQLTEVALFPKQNQSQNQKPNLKFSIPPLPKDHYLFNHSLQQRLSPKDIFRNLKTQMLVNKTIKFDESPQPLSTNRTNSTIARKLEIYSDNYWKNRTDKHLLKEKSMHDQTKQYHDTIRQLELNNLQLQKELRQSQKQIDELQIQQVMASTIQRRSCRTSLAVLDQGLQECLPNLVNEEYYGSGNQFSNRLQMHSAMETYNLKQRDLWVSPQLQIKEDLNESKQGQESTKGAFELFTQDFNINDDQQTKKDASKQETLNSILDYSKYHDQSSSFEQSNDQNDCNQDYQNVIIDTVQSQPLEETSINRRPKTFVVDEFTINHWKNKKQVPNVSLEQKIQHPKQGIPKHTQSFAFPSQDVTNEYFYQESTRQNQPQYSKNIQSQEFIHATPIPKQSDQHNQMKKYNSVSTFSFEKPVAGHRKVSQTIYQNSQTSTDIYHPYKTYQNCEIQNLPVSSNQDYNSQFSMVNNNNYNSNQTYGKQNSYRHRKIQGSGSIPQGKQQKKFYNYNSQGGFGSGGNQGNLTGAYDYSHGKGQESGRRDYYRNNNNQSNNYVSKFNYQ